MRTASITETKASFSEYLKVVIRTGNEMLVTDRGKVIARLCPPLRSDTPEDSRMAQLELAGLVKVGKGHFPDGFWDTPVPRDRKSSAVMALLAEREEKTGVKSLLLTSPGICNRKHHGQTVAYPISWCGVSCDVPWERTENHLPG